MSTATTGMERSWTTVGAEFVKRLGREDVEREIAALDWQDIPSGGAVTVAFMPGEAINAVIRELRLPKVSAFAISSFERPGSRGEDGFYPGFYGIEANYTNGRAHVYVLDTGTSLTPLCSDFWPADEEGSA